MQQNPIRCPICKHVNVPGAISCSRCGADFTDPDLMEMAPGDSTELPSSSLGEAGEMSSGTFLRFPLEGLVSGESLRTLGFIGVTLLAAGWLMPLAVAYTDWKFAWSLLGDGPKVALLYPLVAIAAGVGAALATRIDAWIRAAILAGAGLLGLILSLTPLGVAAAAPEKLIPLYLVGVLIAGAAAAVRILRPLDDYARYGLVAGVALVFVGLVIPLDQVGHALSGEYRLFLQEDQVVGRTPLAVLGDGVGHDMRVSLLSLWYLLPLGAIPLFAAVGWKKPTNVWDSSATLLRPLAVLLALFVPLTFAFMIFNALGWDDIRHVYYGGMYVKFEDFNSAVLLGRTKLGVMATAYALWVVVAAVPLYEKVTRGTPPTPDR